MNSSDRKRLKDRLKHMSAKPSPITSQDEIDRITDKDRPLTGSEIATLTQAIKPDGLQSRAKNTTELARILDVHRTTINLWKKSPDFPKARTNGSYDVAEVQEWRRKHADKLTTSADLIVEDEAKELLRERMRIDNEIRRMKRDEAKGELVSKHIVFASQAAAMTEVKNELMRIETRAKDLEGLKDAEISKRLMAWHDEALVRLYAPLPDDDRKKLYVVLERVLAELNPPPTAAKQ